MQWRTKEFFLEGGVLQLDLGHWKSLSGGGGGGGGVTPKLFSSYKQSWVNFPDTGYIGISSYMTYLSDKQAKKKQTLSQGWGGGGIPPNTPRVRAWLHALKCLQNALRTHTKMK